MGLKLKQLLTEAELQEVRLQNRALLEEARKKHIAVTETQKRNLWHKLVSKKIAKKRRQGREQP